jgi:hypothetical protein
MGHYEVDSKILGSAISKCLGIIALGDKAESNSITLIFSKKGLSVEAHNSVAQYRTDIPVDIIKPAKMRVSILPELLLSYSGSYKKLVLNPKEEHLTVKGGKTFSADMYFVGNNDEMKVDKPEDTTDISGIALVASRVLNMVSGIKNRTDSQVLGVKLLWNKNILELTIGDTHHAVIVDSTTKHKGNGEMVMTLPNLQKIMTVGKNFASEENRMYAWSDVEYLSIMGQSENVFLANAAREVLKGKKVSKVIVDTEKFQTMVNTLVSAVEESSPIQFKISNKAITANVRTGASNARGAVKVNEVKGKSDIEVAVSIHHLKDCLSTMKEKVTTIVLYKNMLALESSGKDTKVVAAMSCVGVK